MNFLQVVKYELKLMFRKDPKRAFFLFGASAFYVILFSLLYSTHVVKNIPVVIYDQDQTQLSRSVIQAFEDSERYQIVAHVTTQEDMEEYIHEKKAQAAIGIPPNFSRDVKSGISSRILVNVNGANIVIGNSIISSAQEIVSTLNGQISQQAVQKTGVIPNQAAGKVVPVDLRMRVINNPALSYTDFFVLGVGMTALQQGVFLAIGASMVHEYQHLGNLSGIPSLTVLLAKILLYWLGGTLSFILSMSIGVNVFDIPCKGSLLQVFLLGSAFVFTMASIGTLIAAFCKSEVSYTQTTLIYAVPAFVYSGYTWPRHAMDAFSYVISATVPLTYVSDTLRDVMLTGYSAVFGQNVGIILAIGAAAFTLSAIMFERRRRHITTGDTSQVV